MRTLTHGWHIGYSVDSPTVFTSDIGMLMPTRSMHRLSWAAGAVLLATTLAACGGTPTAQVGLAHSRPPRPPLTRPRRHQRRRQTPSRFKPNVKNGATGVKVDTVVTVTANRGHLDQGEAELHQ